MFPTLFLFAPVFFSSYATASTATACNNSPTLCNRAYGNVTLLGAHDSAFLRDSSTGNSIAGDQSYNTVAQLDAGARLLTAQVHSATAADGTQEWHLCHSYCFLLDAGRLSDWLRNISTWMDAHPHEVVTILLVNSDAASAEDLDSEFVASGVKKYVYTPPSPATASDAAIPAAKWPTLQQMIAADTRLVTFVASLANDNTGASYLLDEFTYVYENAYDNSSPDSFVCTPDRPSTVKGNPDAAAASNRLFLMNHFLYTDLGDSIQVPDLSAINATNAESGAGSLGAAVRQCEGVYGRAPLAVLVDFVGDGGSVEVVDRVNGVVGAVGRAGVAGAGAGAATGVVRSEMQGVATASASGTTRAAASTDASSSSTRMRGTATSTLTAGFAESAGVTASETETGAVASATDVRMSGAENVRARFGCVIMGFLSAGIVSSLGAFGGVI